MASAAYIAWLKTDRTGATVLAHLNYMTEVASAPVAAVHYLSDRPYINTAIPRPYVDAIVSVPQYKRDLTGDNFGSYSSSVGTLELANEDGVLDGLVAAFTAGHTIDFYYGDESWAFSSFELIFSAKIVKVIAPSFGRLSVQLADTGILIDRSIGGDIKVGGIGPNSDRFRPLGFGYVRQVECMVLDEANLRYVCTDTGMGTTGMTYDIVTVRDRGTGVLYTDNGDGTFDLTYSPAGAITADVLYYASGTDHICVSDAMVHLVGDRAGLINLGHYAGAGVTYDTRPGSGIPAWLDAGGEDYAIGLLNFEKRNIIDLLTEIGDTGLNFWAITRLGDFTFGRIRPHDIAGLSVASLATIYEADFKAGSMKIDHADPMYYRLSCIANKNWSSQSDFAGVLTPNQRGVLSRKGLGVIQNPTSGTQYNANPQNYNLSLAVSPEIETLLSADNDVTGDLRARHWMNVARAKQAPWIETVSGVFGIEHFELELGDPVTLQMFRYGYDAGELVQVVGIDINLTDGEVALRLCRRSTSSISASLGGPLPPEEPVPLPPVMRGRSALRFDTGTPPPGAAMSMVGGVWTIDPVTFDAVWPGQYPIPSTNVNFETRWDALVAYGGDPNSCLAVIVDLSGTGNGTFEMSPLLWFEDLGAGTVDFYGIEFGGNDGTTRLTGSIVSIDFPTTPQSLNLGLANNYPTTSGTEGRTLPAWTATRKDGAVENDVIEVVVNGAFTIRMIAFIKDGDYTGFTNVYDRLWNNVTLTGVDFTAVAVAPDTGSAFVVGSGTFGYYTTDLGFDQSGSYVLDGTTPPASFSVNFADLMQQIGNLPRFSVDDTSTITFDPSGDIPSAHGDFTISKPGNDLVLNIDGVNAPYSGMTLYIEFRYLGVSVAGDWAGYEVNPVPLASIAISFT
jgi:hypothetical protein